MASLQT